MPKTKNGFTLIELLVVIAIIGILATISVLALSNARAKSRDAKRAGDVKQIQTALELFFNDNNRYPTVEEWNTGKIYSTTTGVTSTYMQIIPNAPTPADGTCTDAKNTVGYTPSEDGTSYSISFCLGNTTGTLTPGPKCLTPGGIIDVDCSVSEAPLASKFMVNNLNNGGLGGKMYAYSILQADDGNYVGAGHISANDGDGILLKIDNSGNLVTDFATGGRYLSNASGQQTFYSTEKTVDGGYIAVGALEDIGGNFDSYFVKFTSSGVLDNNFGTNGVMAVSVGSSCYVNSVKQTADGGYIATGFYSDTGKILVIKLTQSGVLDTAFDSDGIVVLSQNGDGKSIIQDSAGKYLLVSNNMVVVKLDVNGSLDTGFGTNGVVVISNPSYYFNAYSIINVSGSYVVVGDMEDNVSGSYDSCLVKLTSNGSLDNSFGVNGISKLTIVDNQSFSAVALDDDGGLVGAGYYSDGSIHQGFVAKVSSSGVIDTSFGSNGSFKFGSSSWNSFRDIKKTSDGGFIAFGDSNATGSYTFFAVKMDGQGSY
ncbi:MAG: prepilin-type N-terminal cleavage/methylation domain-containing protein [Candidatus Falkowbacteria bacterium]